MSGLDMSCQETAEIALKLVQDFGKFFLKTPAQCDRSYTTPCKEYRFSKKFLLYFIMFCFSDFRFGRW